MPRLRNDGIRTARAVPAFVLHFGLVILVAGAALLLIPVIGWQIAAVVAVVIGIFVPQSYSGWLAIACITIGVLLGEASVWRAMIAVLVVHLCHVVLSLLLAISLRARVVLAALWASLRRLLAIQAVAQPLTVLVMILYGITDGEGAGASVVWLAPLAGAGALAIFAIVFLLRVNRSERGS